MRTHARSRTPGRSLCLGSLISLAVARPVLRPPRRWPARVSGRPPKLRGAKPTGPPPDHSICSDPAACTDKSVERTELRFECRRRGHRRYRRWLEDAGRPKRRPPGGLGARGWWRGSVNSRRNTLVDGIDTGRGADWAQQAATATTVAAPGSRTLSGQTPRQIALSGAFDRMLTAP